MDISSTTARIAGSALAGALGFLVGFYAGFFLALSIWGLETDELAFVAFTGGFGSMAAGAAIAWTVSSGRKLAAFLTALALGILAMAISFLFDADPVALGIGGFLVVVATATLVRTGVTDVMMR